MRWEVRSIGSNNFEMMWYMDFGVNTKYVFGLPLATQIGLEHKEKKPKDYDHCQPSFKPSLWELKNEERNNVTQNLCHSVLTINRMTQLGTTELYMILMSFCFCSCMIWRKKKMASKQWFILLTVNRMVPIWGCVWMSYIKSIACRQNS